MSFTSRLFRRLAPAAATTATLSTITAAVLNEKSKEPPQVCDLPPECEDQRFVPTARYGAWDRNWDKCQLTDRAVAKALNHDYPITDYAAAIRKLYKEHAPTRKDVDKLIAEAAHQKELPALYRRAYLQHAYGGAVTRHIILVRHGQYEEQRELYRPLAKADRDFGMPMDEKHWEVDAKQVLTPLGRQQAEATGVKLKEILSKVLTTPGRESQVRVHVSNLARAKETADIILKHLPSERVRRLPPDPNLAEGWPLAHRIPFPDGAPQAEARDVHVEGARIEAAFRALFYRGKPGQPPPPKAADSGAAEESGSGGGDGISGSLSGKKVPRHEYDIVVCHGNVIRYFALRALQLPPEAWLRLCTFNCSLTHIVIWPHGGVSLNSLGDVGHLTMEETTFSMNEGYEW